MPQNFAQVHEKIAKAWKNKSSLKLRQQLRSANNRPKQHKANLAEIAIKVSK